ncbi:hypothetical protein BMR06_13495, partial [Methylococcaceae bacterium HT5]
MNKIQNKTSEEVATTDNPKLAKKTPLGEQSSWLDSVISWQSDGRVQITPCTVLEALQKTTDGCRVVTRYRKAVASGDARWMAQYKSHFECFSPLGKFRGSISEESFIPDSCTNTFVVSIDDLPYPKDADKLKKRLSDLPFVRFCYISYSGWGLEIGIHVPNFRNDADIKNIFGHVAKYFKDKLDLKIDKSSNAITRVSYFSSDSEVYINKGAIMIDVDNLTTTDYPDLSEDLKNTNNIIQLKDRMQRLEEGRRLTNQKAEVARFLEQEGRQEERNRKEKEEEEAEILGQKETKRARRLAQEEAKKERRGEAASKECERIEYPNGKIAYRIDCADGEAREFDGKGRKKADWGNGIISWEPNPDEKKQKPASSGDLPKSAKPNQDSKGALDDEGIKKLVDEMNKEYAVVSLGGKIRVAKLMDNGTYSFQTFADFQNFFSNKTVTVLNDEKYTKVSKAAIWRNSPDRKEYSQGIEFYPTIGGSDRDNDKLNVWNGFGYERKAYKINRIQPILDYIKDVVCGGNDEYYSYVIGWISKGFQKPHIPAGTAIVLRGVEGSGKSTLGLILANLWGNSGMIIEDSDHLTGKFNNQLMNCAFLAGNEAVYHGDKKAQSKLKSLVTDTSLIIEGKGVDAIKIRNCLKIILSANDDWVIQTSSSQRRFFCLEVKNRFGKKADSRAYYNNLYGIIGDDES